MTSIALAVGVVLIVTAGCANSDDGESDSRAAIEAYQSAYNTGDIDAVMALFAEDATITDHPLADQAAVGIEAIRDLHEVDMGEAAASEAYEVANIDSDGDTVTWDHTWTNSDGQQWCAQGNTAVIADGTIISWAFAPNPELCN